MKSIFRNRFVRWLGVPCLILATIVFVVSAFHSNGFCISQWRFVSQSELIQTAVKDELFMLSQSQKFEDETLKQNDLVTHFLSVEDFELRNPTCCSLAGNRENYNIYGAYPLFTGAISNSVALRYQFEFKNSEGVVGKRSHVQEIPVSSCARIEVEVYRNPIGRPFPWPYL
jgi:hypothetical protein